MSYVTATVITGIAVTLRLSLESLLQEQSRYAFLLPTVFICAVYGGIGPGLVATFLGAILTVLLIIPPQNSFDMSNADRGGLIVYFLISAGVMWLTLREMEERRRRLATERQLEQVNRDLELKVAERTAELKAANEELESFCHSMAHDLRTPTRAIAGNARILIEDHAGSLKPELQDHLGRINAAAVKLGLLVDGLLTYARLARQDLHLSDVPLGWIAAEMATVEARRAKVPLHLEIDESIGVRADESQIRILLRALIDNSLMYREGSEPATIRIHRSGNEVVFGDEGIGFDMAYVHKVFLPFERLHRDEAYPGVGMGLANVERVIKRHGGEVSIDAAPGRGTRVRMTIPNLLVVTPPKQAVTSGVR